MSETEVRNTVPAPAELAAGGLIWSGRKQHRRLAVVHRVKHNDWTLPKGRLAPQDATLQDTATREAKEETGYDVLCRRMAGSYSYVKDERPKVVVMWHMVCDKLAGPDVMDPKEIDEVRWLSPAEAISTLTHASEQEFVAQHCAQMLRCSAGTSSTQDPKLNRLQAALCGCREQLRGILGRPATDAEAWWADCARHSLEAAEAALKRRDCDGGWGAVHDARRFMVFGMEGPELLPLISTLDAETTAKLKGWRLEATNRLLHGITSAEWAKNPSSLTGEQQTQVRHAVVESLSLLNEHSDNLYHRLGLVGKQLNYLVVWCAILIAFALFGSYLFVPAGSIFDWGQLAAVGLAGALGGVVSAMFQLSRVGEAKIPDALMHGLITSGRPLVGAASALFIYAVMRSGVINIIDASKVGTEAGLALGFVAGFGEQFVLGAVAKVAGGSKADALAGGTPPRGIDSIDQFDNGPGPDENKLPAAPTRALAAQGVPQAQKKPAEALPEADVLAALPEPAQGRESKAIREKTDGTVDKPVEPDLERKTS